MLSTGLMSAPLMQSFDPWDLDIRDYWPKVANGSAITVSYSHADLVQPAYPINGYGGITRYVYSAPQGLSESFIKEDYASYPSITLQDKWRMKYAVAPNGAGSILEYADDFPPATYAFLSTPIAWGGRQSLSDIFSIYYKQDPSQSSGLSVDPSNLGINQIWVRQLLPSFTNPFGLVFTDVLKVQVYQAYCNDAVCSAPTTLAIVDYWLAKGIGQIGLDYTYPTYTGINAGKHVITHATNVHYGPDSEPITWRTVGA
jgi:hypothetical protein